MFVFGGSLSVAAEPALTLLIGVALTSLLFAYNLVQEFWYSVFLALSVWEV